MHSEASGSVAEGVHNVQVTVIVVSFNTCALLRECLTSVDMQCSGVGTEMIVVDNGSRDGSPEMVRGEFPKVKLLGYNCNLGFAAANNRALIHARGRYVVMLNSDAFMHPDALAHSIDHMERNPRAGLASGRLLDRDSLWRPSARMFPSPLNKLLAMTGLADRFPSSRFFGRCNRTWADPSVPAQVDWVGGAYMIVRREVLERVGYFDERFFLYFEEIDLCRRIKAAGYEIWFWPDVAITHIGGASTQSLLNEEYQPGVQLSSWRMRSELLYYRKYHGELGARCTMAIEKWWHRARLLRNHGSRDKMSKRRVSNARHEIAALRQAWLDTEGGRVSPPRPWTFRSA